MDICRYHIGLIIFYCTKKIFALTPSDKMNVSSSLLSHYSRETNSTLYLGSNSFSLYHRKCLYRCLDSEISRCSFFIQHIGRKHETIIQSSNTDFKFTGIFELFRNNTKLTILTTFASKAFAKYFWDFSKSFRLVAIVH